MEATDGPSCVEQGQISAVHLLPRSGTLEAKLDKLTLIGVNLSMFAFLALQLPQIAHNFLESPDKMRSLAWAGYVSGSMGNVSLCSYFTGISEFAQARVQAIGCVTTYLVLAQVYNAGFCPGTTFAVLSTVLGVGLTLPLLLSLKLVSPDLFSLWKDTTTAIGFTALAFAVTATFTGDQGVLLGATLAGLSVGLLVLALKNKSGALGALVGTLGGWLATFLFMWSPLPQLVALLQGGDEGWKAAEAFDIGVALLATLGNGLGVARAWFIKDKIWFVGSFFGIVVQGWLTAAAVWVVDPARCPWWALLPFTVALVSYFTLILRFNGAAKQESIWQQTAFLRT